MLKKVTEIAMTAGRFLADSAERGVQNISLKSAGDYVTEVDLKAEEIILEGLTQAFPGSKFLAEETGGSRSMDGSLWIIDPLDGTKNFIHGVPVYCVSIALYEQGRPRLGVIYDPCREELFTAESGKGTHRKGEKVSIAGDWSVEQSIVATGFPFRCLQHLDTYLNCFRGIFPRVNGMRRAGSACLDQSYVACGRYHGFWEFGLSPWDVAAGSLLVKEAGGVVTDFSGGDDYLFGGDILTAAPRVHEILLEEVGKVFGSRRPHRDRL